MIATKGIREYTPPSVNFDIIDSGKKWHTGWIKPATREAFLVHPNKDGSITSGRNLFGQVTDGIQMESGFHQLASRYDKNNDGKVSGDELKDLALWFDNGDGILQDGELKKLSELCPNGQPLVSEISTKYEKDMTAEDNLGNRPMYKGTAVVCGKRISIYDVFFLADGVSNE